MNRTYIAIDLKSFYASVECVSRGLDPLKTNLVVADKSRTEKTICLAVSPSLKSFGIPGRPRLFEVVQRVKEVNIQRKRNIHWNEFSDKSHNIDELSANPSLELFYVVAPPRMAQYMKVSTQIYQIYLKYIAPEDIHVYSVDEVFMDVTNYLNTYGISAHELAMKMIQDVLKTTGITATAGIGTNLYLCKVAMDIVAKHIPADKDGVRIAELDELSYRRKLWSHRPLTDFWRVGKGYTKKLEENGLYTMGDIARCSLDDEEKLYKLFGVNAELLIDHAWGYEPCTIAEIKAYKPEGNSISSGQVLSSAYTFEKAKIVVWEMADQLALDLVNKKVVTDQIILTIGYDIENLTNPNIRALYHGEITTDRYGRSTPKHAHGTERLAFPTSSSKVITDATMRLFERIVNPDLLVRRVTLCAGNIQSEGMAEKRKKASVQQLDLFSDYGVIEAQEKKEEADLERDRKIQDALLTIKKKYGKNAVMKGANLQEGATARERNAQIGGHKAGEEQ